MDEEMEIDVVADENGQQINPEQDVLNRTIDDPIDDDDEDRVSSNTQ